MNYDDFKKTPSFYNNEEVFKKYLGRTSYYLGLQKALYKIITLAIPLRVLELGSGTGDTVNFLAKQIKTVQFTAIDIRQEMVDIGEKTANVLGNSNITFELADMYECIKKPELEDFIYMLYSFHHVVDPLENKVNFLKDLYNNMKSGSRLCIAEAFLPEHTSEVNLSSQLKDIWASRSLEGYSSTFWESLSGLNKEDIDYAKKVGQYSFDYEWYAGELVSKRKDEYLVTINWLKNTAMDVGFKIELIEPTNNNQDYVVLLKKE